MCSNAVKGFDAIIQFYEALWVIILCKASDVGDFRMPMDALERVMSFAAH